MRLRTPTMTMTALLATLLSTLAVPAPAAAQGVKRLIPFQARLTDGAGEAVTDGVYAVTFAIYDAAEGGEPGWVEHHDMVSVIDGQVNVLLGSRTSLESVASKFGGSPQFLGITLGDENHVANGEMVPRHELVPAFHARSADTAAIASAVEDGKVTARMLAPNAVTRDKILNGEVTGAKIAANAVDSAKIVNGSIRGEDVSTQAGQRITNANIEQGAISDDKLSSALQSLLDGLGDAISEMPDPLQVQSNSLRIGDLQICWGRMAATPTLSTSGIPIVTHNITFPTDFINNPTVFTSLNGRTVGYGYVVYSYTVRADGFSSRGIEVQRRHSTEPVDMTYIAIGPWRQP